MDEEPDYYRMFCNALRGLIDDAEMCGYDSDGLTHLREASEYFESHWRIVKTTREQDANRDGSE